MPCQRTQHRAEYCKSDQSNKRSKRSHPRSRRAKKHRGKCKPGKVTRNPFFNFLRIYRAKHCGWEMPKVAAEGAKCWCRLNDHDKARFRQEACKAPKMGRRSRRFSRERRHALGRSRGRRHSSGKSRGRRHRSGRSRDQRHESGRSRGKTHRSRRRDSRKSSRSQSRSGSCMRRCISACRHKSHSRRHKSESSKSGRSCL